MNQEKTNEQLKQEILIELFNTGRIDQMYFGKTSKSGLNPLRAYIKNKLYKSFILENTGVQDNGFDEDLYMELFVNLQNIPADRFIELYHQSKVPGTNLLRYALRIIILKGFAKGRSGNPKHSLIQSMGFASVFNTGNFSIQPMETDPDEEATTDNLILYDLDEETEFEKDYGMTVEEILDMLTDEERFVMEKLIGKQSPGRKSKAVIEERQQLCDTLKAIKVKIEVMKGIN